MTKSELLKAVITENPKLLTELLNAGGDPDHEEPGWPPLLIVAVGEHGNAEVVQVLLDAGADMDRSARHLRWGEWPNTPLVAAAIAMRTDILRMLVEAGADVTAVIYRDRNIMDWLDNSRHPAHAERLEIICTARPEKFMEWWTSRKPQAVTP